MSLVSDLEKKENKKEKKDTIAQIERVTTLNERILDLEMRIEEAEQADSTKILGSLEDIDHLMILMKKNMIDYAEIEGCKFTKTQHDLPINMPKEAKENDFWVNPHN